MNFLPININIEDETILIIGGGKVAIHKIESLERFTQKIKVIAKEVVPEIRDRSFIEIVEKPYESDDLNGHLLVYAATNDTVLNTQIRNDGHQRRCIVNVVDKPENCDFVSPAIYKQDKISVAVGSNGENVFAAIHWRNQIRDLAEKGIIRTTKSKDEYRDEFNAVI
ncbi:precorrin-2 dehydrogenase/sirohydrochlorin ferrochelatase family protein [Carboxylicivirga sp. RSCT41]|uniref:precorrin-2 dehydrogenase/sirohydrochlorin ferrochelatase family protein n=1 Tax=Carboxylicivirga agarovorans TaxID=3417570 RepID=UPI003D3279D1